MKYKVLKYFLNRDGATAIEYGLILAGLAVFITIVVFSMGDSLVNMFGSLDAVIQKNVP